jgi:hypothetical protein
MLFFPEVYFYTRFISPSVFIQYVSSFIVFFVKFIYLFIIIIMPPKFCLWIFDIQGGCKRLFLFQIR